MHLHYPSSLKVGEVLEQNVFHSEIKWKIYLFFQVLIAEKAAPEVLPSIYFHGKYDSYEEHNSTVS